MVHSELVCVALFVLVPSLLDLLPLLLLCMMQQEIPTQRNKNQRDYLQKHGTTLKVECVIGVQIILVMFVYK